MLRPTLFLELNTSTFPDYTQFKIGNRYYNITDITSVRNNLFEVSGVVDVLATYKAEILASTQLVARNANTYQPLLADKAYPVFNKTQTQYQNISFSPALDSDGTYIVGIINPDAKNGVAYYTFGETNFRELMSRLFSDAWLPNLSLENISADLQKELINPFQYIVSCTWYPFNIKGERTEVKFGYWETSTPTLDGIYAGLLSESDRIYSIEGTGSMPRHPQVATHGTYMNGSPFTRYNLECWCFGSLLIDPLPFVQNPAFAFEVDVDLFTGMATMYLDDSHGVRQIKESTQFGCPIQISQMSSEPLKVAGSLVGGRVSAATAALGFLTANPTMAIGGIVGMGASAMSAFDACLPQLQTAGCVGSKISFMWSPRIEATFFEPSPLAADKIGRPLMSKHTLSQLSGFTVCEKPALDLAATETEKAEVINYLSTGFYIE